MSKLHRIQPYVEEALRDHPETRTDNFLLYKEVLKNCHIDPRISIEDAFTNHKILGLPPFESIPRCKRKLFEKYPDLRPSKEAQAIFYEEEEEYKKYARDDD